MLVKVDTTAGTQRLVWVTSMSYADPRTTNNQAEYQGLLHGIRHAQRAGCSPLHVVGDSTMIIAQQTKHHASRKPALAVLYREVRHMADTMDISSWTHHYRPFNKMADLAANQAIDTKSSMQYGLPTVQASAADIKQHLHSDVNHWLELRQPEPDASQRDRPDDKRQPQDAHGPDGDPM